MARAIGIACLLWCVLVARAAIASPMTVYVSSFCGDDARSGIVEDCASPFGPVRTIARGLALLAANPDGGILELRGLSFAERLVVPPVHVEIRGLPGLQRPALVNPTPSVPGEPLVTFAPAVPRTLKITNLDLLSGFGLEKPGAMLIADKGALELQNVALSNNATQIPPPGSLATPVSTIHITSSGTFKARSVQLTHAANCTALLISGSGAVDVQDSAFSGGTAPIVSSLSSGGVAVRTWERARFAFGANKLFVDYNSDVRFKDCVFEGLKPGSDDIQAALHTIFSRVAVEGCTFSNNQGDAIVCYNNSGVVQVGRSTFSSNVPGMIYASDGLSVDRCTIQSTSAGPLIQTGAEGHPALAITNTIIRGGGHALRAHFGDLVVNHCTFIGQTSFPLLPGVDGSIIVRNSIFTEQGAPISDINSGYPISVANCIVDRQWPGATNLLIPDPGLGPDGSPPRNSPAIDRGNPLQPPGLPAGEFDVYGRSRTREDPGMPDIYPSLTIPATPAGDLGAVESQVNSCIADLSGDGFVDDTDFVYFAIEYDFFNCPGLRRGCAGDFNFDAVVDDTDFTTFAASYSAFACP